MQSHPGLIQDVSSGSAADYVKAIDDDTKAIDDDIKADNDIKAIADNIKATARKYIIKVTPNAGLHT